MVHMNQELTTVPTGECIASPREQIMGMVLNVNAQLFSAALSPIVVPEGAVVQGASRTIWTVDGDGVALSIRTKQSLDKPAVFEAGDLLTSGYRVTLQTSSDDDRRGGRFDVSFQVMDDPQLLPRPYSEHLQVTPAQLKAGEALLRSFLSGEVTAQTQTLECNLGMLGTDGSWLSANEAVMRTDDQQPVKSTSLEVIPHEFGTFSFASHIILGHIDSLQYRDERDRAIDATRNVLTTGRLDEIERRCEMGVRQLEEYHGAYLAAQYSV